ncbi:uncharacterized protein YjiS (DUF1127 family) [Roseibium hamelinense]|uniref:Uncharacterized protein YjiS (DUF1127 family) n=1 Tax=Roseibium hamelinense TaxID=150831 RepID=A0A562T3H0_9HYPH|nr:DUF1127 domain-containing protein [Roseibium hamelinense]TWI87536.1 uncharacterized protein YjiS (DUF1127 family) [Roseibium hamelinense]
MSHVTFFASISALSEALTRVTRIVKNRRQVTRLTELSDDQLCDIGLKRADVHHALRLPLWSNTAAVLNGWADERRLATPPSGFFHTPVNGEERAKPHQFKYTPARAA